MPITYEGGWIIVQGDYSGSINIFEQIFEASIAGAWGIEIQRRNYMELTPAGGVQFGKSDQASQTLVISRNENIKITEKPIKCLGNSNYLTVLTLGEYDEENDLTRNGTNLMIQNNAPSYMNSIDITDLFSEFNAYGSKIHILGIGLVQYNWVNFYGPVKLIDTGFFGQAGQKSANVWLRGATGVVKRVKLTEGSYGLLLSIPSLECSDIICNDNEYGFGAFSEGAAQGVTVKNARAVSGNAICTFDYLSAGYIFTFLNCVIDNSKVEYFYPADTGLQIIEQFTVNIKCLDKQGDPIEGVIIKAWDNTQDPLVDEAKFEALTDEGGIMLRQIITVSQNKYNNVYASYNPFSFLLQKQGWKDKWIITDVTAKKDWIFSMDKALEPVENSEIYVIKMDLPEIDIDILTDNYELKIDILDDQEI